VLSEYDNDQSTYGECAVFLPSLCWLSDCFRPIYRRRFNIWIYVALSDMISPKMDYGISKSGFRWRKWCSISGFSFTFSLTYLTTLSPPHMFGRMFVGLWIMKRETDPGGCQRSGLRPHYYWYRGFEPRWGHCCCFLVFVVRCVGSGLCDEPIIRSEKSYRLCVCLIMCDIVISKLGGLDHSWAVAWLKKWTISELKNSSE